MPAHAIDISKQVEMDDIFQRIKEAGNSLATKIVEDIDAAVDNIVRSIEYMMIFRDETTGKWDILYLIDIAPTE